MAMVRMLLTPLSLGHPSRDRRRIPKCYLLTVKVNRRPRHSARRVDYNATVIDHGLLRVLNRGVYGEHGKLLPIVQDDDVCNRVSPGGPKPVGD